MKITIAIIAVVTLFAGSVAMACARDEHGTCQPVVCDVNKNPGYTDTAPLPAAGQSALWKYKAIYRQGDDRVGQWSDVVSIPVAG